MIYGDSWVNLGSIFYEGRKYQSRTKVEDRYFEKQIPTFPQMAQTEVDFGLGLKKIDGIFVHDVKRMHHSFQGCAIPKKLTEDDAGIDAVYNALYWMAGDSDEVFFKITQIYNQRIGLDLVYLAREQMGQKVEHLDSQNYHLDLSLEEVFDENRPKEKVLHLIATACISGDIQDPETGRVLPVRYHVHGRYDLTTDQALHTISYRKK